MRLLWRHAHAAYRVFQQQLGFVVSDAGLERHNTLPIIFAWQGTGQIWLSLSFGQQ
jgi:hypothetical protein